ncbi:hypothetical protein EMCRGX_G033784 [Ephydatia muelleri]
MAGEPRFKRVKRHLHTTSSSPGPASTFHQFKHMAGFFNRDTTFLLRQLKTDLELVVGAHEVLRVGDTQASLTDCSRCLGFMVHPLCLPCGHSMCKTCFTKSSCIPSGAIVCAACKKGWARTMPGTASGGGGRDRIPSIIVQTLFQKWFPHWVESARHREEGNAFAGERDYPLAVMSYDRALETGVTDHRVLSNRSMAHISMERYDEALKDSIACCYAKPFWAKAHHRRGVALEKMNQWPEALAAYLLCLYLGGEDSAAVCKILDKHKAQLSPLVKRRASPQGEVAPIVGTCVESLLEFSRNQEDREMSVPKELLDCSDVEILYQPVTTPCGHSFCSGCLSRSFDHSPFCPVCRNTLVETFEQYTTGDMNIDVTLDGIVSHYFSEPYKEKALVIEAERKRKARVGLSEDEVLPIFMCTMAFPGMPCPLHVFEPRYRLMMRRCMQAKSCRFGMCYPSSDGSFVDYGTVLHITSLETTPDGRMLVTTVGERRFKVLSRGMQDGYSTATIQFINDEPVSGEQQIASLKALHQEIWDHTQQWLGALPAASRLKMIQDVCSPLPECEPHPQDCPNGPTWVWWYISTIPMSLPRRIDLFSSTSLTDRLLKLRETMPLPNQQRH